MNKSDYREQGTSLSGYVETGKQYCGDCVHRLGETDKCIHPVVVVDPELSSHTHGDNWVRIDLAKGCCRFVKLGEPSSNPLLKVVQIKNLNLIK